MTKAGPIHDRLRALGIRLPAPKQPVALYKPGSIDGNRYYFSGHGPWVDGLPIVGKLGASMTVSEGAQAAYHVGLGILSTLDAEVGLERIEKLYRAFGMVNSAPYFTEHPAVIDGFSKLMRAVFGPEKGVGARSAIGVAGLPFGIPVEIEGEFILHS